MHNPGSRAERGWSFTWKRRWPPAAGCRRRGARAALPALPLSLPSMELGGTHPPSRRCHWAGFPDQQQARPGKSSAPRQTQRCLCSPSAGPGSAACSPLWETRGHRERDRVVITWDASHDGGGIGFTIPAPPRDRTSAFWLPPDLLAAPKDKVPSPSGPAVSTSTIGTGLTHTCIHQHHQRTPGQPRHQLPTKILLNQPLLGKGGPSKGVELLQGPCLPHRSEHHHSQIQELGL